MYTRTDNLNQREKMIVKESFILSRTISIRSPAHNMELRASLATLDRPPFARILRMENPTWRSLLHSHFDHGCVLILIF